MVPRGLAMTLATAVVIMLAVVAQARSGVVPDLGLLAPVAVTGAPESVDAESATVSGLVTPNGNATTARFDYGPTAGYGQQTDDIAVGAGLVPAGVSGQLTGLTPGTLVHYRLVASSSAGTATGGDRVLITPSPSGLTPPGGGPGLPGAGGGDDGGGGGGNGVPLPGATTSLGRTAAALVSEQRPVLGEDTTLAVRTRDPGDAVTGIAVDFGERRGQLVASACERDADGDAPETGPLARDRDGTFALTYAYQRSGPHRVVIDLLGGTCDRPSRRLRRLVTIVDVQPAARASSRRSRTGPTARAARVQRPAPSPHAAAAASPSGCPDAETVPTRRNARRLERAVRCLVAVERAAHGLPGLRPDRRLTRAARAHERDMQRRRYLGHSHRRGPTLGARLARVGYAGRAGETIGVGIGTLATPRAVVDSWMNSAVHRHVLLGPRYRVIGAAVSRGAPLRASDPKATFVANLGTR